MLTHLNPFIRLVAQAAVLFTPLASIAQETDNQAIWPTHIAVQTEAGQQIPTGAYGVVQIQSPRVANLLQLRGVMGRGTAIIRSDGSHDCLSLRLRFVAGDFGGDSVSTHAAQPIRLILQSARVSNALAHGEDVVSDMYAISSQHRLDPSHPSPPPRLGRQVGKFPVEFRLKLALYHP